MTSPEVAAVLRKAARCPACGSPEPLLHPAVQFEGEVQICRDAFHQRVTPRNTPERIERMLRQINADEASQ